MLFQPKQAVTVKEAGSSLKGLNSPDVLYWPQLDGLRAMAFLMVFLEHQSPLFITPEMATIPGILPLVILINRSMRWGWLGVDIFFVLSAFLITTLLLRERSHFGSISFPRFFLRRILRIWPLYFLIILLGFFVLPACHYYQYPWGSPEWKSMLSTYLPACLVFLGNMKQSFLPKISLSDSLGITWSVAVEEQFYLVWGLILTRAHRLKTLGILILILMPVTVFLSLTVYNEFHQPLAFYFNTFTHLDPILIGVSIALLRNSGNLPLNNIQRWGAVLFIVPIVLFVLLTLLAPPLDNGHISMVFIMCLTAVGAGIFLLSLLYWEPAKRLFSLPLLVWLGQLSFGLYLFHPLVRHQTDALCIAAFRSGLLPNIQWAWTLSIITGLMATILVAWLSWHLMEKHCNRLRKHFMRIPSGSP